MFQINVASAPGSSMGNDVILQEVRLIIRHEWDADLDIHLISPTGIRVELSTDNGSGNDHYGNPNNGLCNQYTTFLSRAAAGACNAISITQGNAPFIGNFLPEGNLDDFNNGTNPLGLWTLEVCDDGMAHYGTLEFVELVFAAVSCRAPSSVSVTTVDSTSVALNWVPGSNCNSTIIEYGPPGFIPGTTSAGNGTIRMTGCPPVVVTGLLPSAKYDLYIRESCSGGSFSGNSCVATFSTKCSPPPATLVENFNAQDICTPVCGISCPLTGVWNNGLNDDFDWLVNEGPTSTSQTGPPDDFPGGGRYVYIETSGSACRNGNKAALISNCILVKANADSCDMSFNYSMNGVHVNSLILEITANGGMTWQQLWQATGNKGPDWHKKFIDLDPYAGQVVQFRFAGVGGSGIRGDIALDNIVFYGSTEVGEPGFHYYLDQDGDGYGQTDVFIASCQSASFPGYAPNPGDCDDNAPFINPGAMESPCDGVDLNCNGFADEQIIPPPQTVHDSVCSGSVGFVSAVPAFGGQIHWYDSPSGGAKVHEGSSFIPFTPSINLTPNPVLFIYYAEEVAANGCASTARSEAVLTVFPQPDISTSDQPEECQGTIFDLSTVDILDANGANGSFRFYDNMPLIPQNEIPNLVSLTTTSTYYIVSTASGGCSDHVNVQIIVKPGPQADILGDTAICRSEAKVITATDLAGAPPPLSFSWNNGSSDPSQTIFSNAIGGSIDKYYVTITASNGCSSVDSLSVTSKVSISSVQSVTQPVTTCNGTNGAITLTPLNGTPPFTYYWTGNNSSTKPGGLTIHNLSQGNYSFTITDSSPEACPFFLPVVVVNGPAASIQVESITNVSCANGTDGCIVLNVEGNNPSIAWSNGPTTEQNCGLPAGNYTVTVTEGNCSNVLNIPISQPSPLTASATIKHLNCIGAGNGSVSLSVFGGTPPYQVQWSGGQNTQNINNLSAGTYGATITDAKGCQHQLQGIVVEQPGMITIDLAEMKQVSCFGMADGRISVSVKSGTPPFNINWSNGGSGSTITNVAAGSYTVNVRDANGCTFSKSFNLGQPDPLQIQLDSSQNPVCDGIDDGFINITPSGGNGNYTFLWSNNKTTEDISGLAAANYRVTVNDQLGCHFISDNISLIGPQNMQMNVVKSDPTCVGIDDGFIEVSVISGGEAPYQFFWSTDDSEPVQSNLPAGSYEITIYDNRGCRIDSTITLISEQPISANITGFSPTCHGTATGQLSLIVSGGVQPYDISWSTGQSGASISGLFAANYTATITDDVGCMFFLDLIPLTQPPKLKANVETVEGNSCHGGSEGSINVHVTGGTQPYNYVWTNGATTEDLSGLMEGLYRLTVTDAKNCTVSTDVLNVVTPDPIQLQADLVLPGMCETANINDTVCINLSGGIPPYNYLWNNGDTSTCLIGAPSGDYNVVVTDAAGCTQQLMSIKIPEIIPGVSVRQIQAGIQQICSGASNGTLTVVISGGAKPYQFIWSNGEFGVTNQDTLRIHNLAENQYFITITDNLGCTSVSELMSVSSYSPLQATIPGAQIQHVKCRNGTDGAINLNISGGQGPFSITWKDSLGSVIANTEDIGNLPAGSYHVQVTDAIGCTSVTSAQVLQPAQAISFMLPPPTLSHVQCFGMSNGSINITTTGGVPPYQFKWSNGAMTEDILGIVGGTYTLTITDSNLCAVQTNFQIEEPGQLLPIVTSTPSVVGQNDGTASASAMGGVPPYHFSWNNGGQESIIENLAPGTYEVTVTDANFCTATATVAVEVLVKVKDRVKEFLVRIFPNPTPGRALLTFESQMLVAPEIIVFNSYGHLVLKNKKLTPDAAGQAEIDLTDHPPGLYLVKILAEGKVVFTGKLVSIP